ncbi:MAG: hypothetical protein IPM16_15525 [Chloroflexi bacterium]|nr:hypothetical protein [Chloroflexota bacterium]
MEMHDLMCCVRLVENRATPADLRDALLPKLTELVDKAVERDPANWPNYTLPPLGIVSSPASPFAHLFEHVLPANLDFMLSWQSEDGGWHPNWNWGYLPEVWAVAERDWTSVLTLTNLKKLRAFGAA